ncbi:MAG: hypothetical protein ACTHME_05765 [Candidatus Nitrosocosmicus sp.]
MKHKKPVHVYNYCNTKENNKLFLFGNIAIPKDKRGLIDRVDINSKLVMPFDIFLESEALSLKKKIDLGKEIVLLGESTTNLYHALFEGATHYDSTNLLLPSKFQEYQSNTSYLNHHANLIRRTANKDFNSVRIMILAISSIEKDWQNSKTRSLSTDFFKWHKEWGVTLLQIDPSITLDIWRNLQDSITSFYIKSVEMGLWKEKYVIQSENFGINKNNDVKGNKIGFLIQILYITKIVRCSCKSYYQVMNYWKYIMMIKKELILSNGTITIGNQIYYDFKKALFYIKFIKT